MTSTRHIVVVGAGAGGLTAALSAREHGSRVTVIEKAEQAGGTALKAAAWFWIPNNHFMREMGIKDPRDSAIAYMARTSRPEMFDLNKEGFGLPAWEYQLIETFYDNAAPVTEHLEDIGALYGYHAGDVPDYFAHLDVDEAPTGRVLIPRLPDGTAGDGREMIKQLHAAAVNRGVDFRYGTRVTGVIKDTEGKLTGIKAQSSTGARTIDDADAVIFASGGFTHNEEMRRNHLSVPVFGGCAAILNEGDFLPIAQSLGAELGNMNYAWLAPIPLEQALVKDPSMSGVFQMPGDSLLFVNRYGERTVNEKAPYNELTQAMAAWDGRKAEYPNLYMFPVWDQRTADLFAGTAYGNFVPPSGGDWSRVVSGQTLPELATALQERLKELGQRTSVPHLAPDFAARLSESIQRFNQFASIGKDLDLSRGETPIELYFHGPARAGAEANPTMVPLSSEGPYYATILVPGTLDTKGGPKVDPHGRVLTNTGDVVPGLYGVGNCVASPSARAYWAGGGTLGPILTFGWLAGKHAANNGAADAESNGGQESTLASTSV